MASRYFILFATLFAVTVSGCSPAHLPPLVEGQIVDLKCMKTKSTSMVILFVEGDQGRQQTGFFIQDDGGCRAALEFLRSFKHIKAKQLKGYPYHVVFDQIHEYNGPEGYDLRYADGALRAFHGYKEVTLK